MLGAVSSLLWKLHTSLQDHRKIQRENEKGRETEIQRERSDARTQTNLSVSIAVSHRLEDKCRNLSRRLCCGDILTTCAVKQQSVGAEEATRGELKSLSKVVPKMREWMSVHVSQLHQQSAQRPGSILVVNVEPILPLESHQCQLFSKSKCLFAPTGTWLLILVHDLFIKCVKTAIYQRAVQQPGYGSRRNGMENYFFYFFLLNSEANGALVCRCVWVMLENDKPRLLSHCDTQPWTYKSVDLYPCVHCVPTQEHFVSKLRTSCAASCFFLVWFFSWDTS